MILQHDIMLTGLIGSNPLGALAAFGLLRACSEIPDLSVARLHWTMERNGAPLHDWIAVLNIPDQIDNDGLIERLVDRQRKLHYSIFYWKDDIRSTKEGKKDRGKQAQPDEKDTNEKNRVSPEEYRDKLEKLARNSTSCNRLEADYLAALGSIVARREGPRGSLRPVVSATPFRMTSGKQLFFEKIRKTGIELHPCPCPKKAKKSADLFKEVEKSRNNTVTAFKEALFGPWKYEAEIHPLGLDPAMERIYALRSLDPSPEPITGVLAAIWLAIEAIPLFPLTVSKGKLRTTGFISRSNSTMLVWPIWTKGIGIDTLRTLLMTSELNIDRKYSDSLRRRGIAAVYSSVRSDSGSSQSDYAVLRPADLAWSL
jgi:hypothetical protein